MESNQILGIVTVLVGMFTFVASSLNMEFFFNNRRAEAFIKIFGRQGARIFYMILGLFLMYVAYLIYLGPH
ncbi:MAG: immunity 17 family protein [Bacteroidia bacterium]|nr:immunity 17 family protein [Bacteroidia bacterium]NNJ56645.1 hypothetical protein [Bacteroidia bacterium]